MEITRIKWTQMPDADKCQYNGYSDFFRKQTEKMKRDELNEAKNKLDTERLQQIIKSK